MVRLFFFTFILLSLAWDLSASAQKDQEGLSYAGGIGFQSLNYKYHFEQHGAILKRGNTDADGGSIFNPGMVISAGLHYRFMKYFAIESGVFMQQSLFMVHDAKFQHDYNVKGTYAIPGLQGSMASLGDFSFSYWYASPWISAYVFIPLTQQGAILHQRWMFLQSFHLSPRCPGYHNL